LNHRLTTVELPADHRQTTGKPQVNHKLTTVELTG
jgi:hypothetical protein